jgi:Tfp pilus assembly protein PilX
MDSLPKPMSARERGAALIIVLVFTVLLTGLVVAYVSRTTDDRTVAHSSFNQTEADELTTTATNYIVTDLQQEIANGSTATTVPTGTGVTIYSPNLAAYMVPQRNVTATMPNLVRRSMNSDTISAPGVSSLASNVNSTNNPSANNRFVSTTRWNKHYLLGSSVPAGFTAAPPDWVILTRQGRAPFSGWSSVLADASPSNLSYAVGRYAYAIYDEGGLLDANVAGFPTNTSVGQYGGKGTAAFGDLTVLGLSQTNHIDQLVGWRNYASAYASVNTPPTFPSFTFTSTTAGNYVNAVLSNTNGFLYVGTSLWSGTGGNTAYRSDQMFPDRQTLLRFCTNLSGFTTDALQYLGTHLRELNAPSWSPSTPTGSTINYANLATVPTPETSTAINRNLLSVRGTGTWTNPRADGTFPVAGEPLIKTRFPLTRLAGVTSTGTPGGSTMLNGALVTATAATVQRDFGLLWDSTNNRWNYVGATGSTIQTSIERLDQVASENREPNFFELLKAVILNGSLGSGNNGNTFVTADSKYYSTPISSDYHIMEIGANIINQWQLDSGGVPVPIFVNFYDSTGNYELAGIKNLPQLSKLVFKPAWIKVSGRDQFAAWLLPSLWNPHQNAPTPATQNVRIAMTSGTMTGYITYSGGASPYASTPITGSSSQYMTVDATSFGTSPLGPTTATPNSGSAITQMAANLGNYYGFNFAFATNASVTPTNSQTAYPDFGSGCTFELQVQVNGTWKAYRRWKTVSGHPLIFSPPASSYWSRTDLQDPEFVTLDPRTLRFGVWGNAGNQPNASVPTDFITGTQTTLDTPPPEAVTALTPSGSIFASPTSANLYLYANNTDATVHYTDLDGLQRKGDITSSTTTDEMQVTNTTDRPLALNGNFRNGVFQSVAELGHVFRNQPWKTLNFTTTDSADAGLLDVFTLHESSMEAGKSSLNARQTPVLTAILSQALKRLAGTSTDLITSTQRDNIVAALQTLTAAQPMVNKAELVTRLAADTSVTSLGNKEARECVMRAFSDACQTRTWNLLIDVVAQSGRYPPNASALAGFMVEGEQHYWVHVAIDRFTGQVIAKQIEIVNE